MSTEAEQYAKHLESEGFVKAAAELRRLSAINAELVQTLERIERVNAMDYEYQAWAREALEKAKQ